MKASREHNIEIVWDGPPNQTDINTEWDPETMINRHVDAIALAPSDPEALVNTVNRAASEGMPVVIYDSAIQPTNMSASFPPTILRREKWRASAWVKFSR